MELLLNSVEIRVLGSLIEKEITTPEYYPMSLNALTNACNQKSNREPVMNLSENEVLCAIDTLKDKKLSWQFSSAGGRVPKYEHNLKSLFTFTKQEIAVLCVLLLRGPQTIGEIRTRTERMYAFSSLDEAEKTVRELVTRTDGPFVAELPRQSGHKESRFVHLFSGVPEASQVTYAADADLTGLDGETLSNSEKIRILEEEVKSLRNEFTELKEQFFDLKKQFE